MVPETILKNTTVWRTQENLSQWEKQLNADKVDAGSRKKNAKWRSLEADVRFLESTASPANIDKPAPRKDDSLLKDLEDLDMDAVEKLPDAALRERLSKYLDLSTRQIQVCSLDPQPPKCNWVKVTPSMITETLNEGTVTSISTAGNGGAKITAESVSNAKKAAAEAEARRVAHVARDQVRRVARAGAGQPLLRHGHGAISSVPRHPS